MSTERMGKEFLICSLIQQGYSVKRIKTHLIATKDDKNLAIAVTSRKLSNVTSKESKPVHMLQSKLDNLIDILPKDKEYEICLGYTVFKYNYNDAVSIILPFDAWEKYAETGTAISRTIDENNKSKFYFSYKKLQQDIKRNIEIISKAKLYLEWKAYNKKLL